jgi:hypothetical protein
MSDKVRRAREKYLRMSDEELAKLERDDRSLDKILRDIKQAKSGAQKTPGYTAHPYFCITAFLYSALDLKVFEMDITRGSADDCLMAAIKSGIIGRGN